MAFHVDEVEAFPKAPAENDNLKYQYGAQALAPQCKCCISLLKHNLAAQRVFMWA